MGATVQAGDDGQSTSMKYSTLHRIRELLIQFTIEHLCWTPTENENISKVLKIWIDTTNILYKIQYEVIKRTTTDQLNVMKMMNIYGVYVFVLHSDCDGNWTGDDRDQVTKWLHLVVPFIARRKPIKSQSKKQKTSHLEVSKNEIQWVEELLSVFEEATRNDVAVEIH